MQVRIKVYGQVQGVFFRHTAKGEAEKLGLTGWIKNNSDGFVEALAEGSRENLEKFVEWCKKGPPAAEVEKVDVEWGIETSEFEKFRIM